MEQLKVKKLTGIILSSANPAKLAAFYIDILGIPLSLNKHGKLPEHWECDFEGMHYAILKGKRNEAGLGNIVPSFEIDNIEEFIKQNGLVMLHPVINLGDGYFVGSIADVDGNILRLWMPSK